MGPLLVLLGLHLAPPVAAEDFGVSTLDARVRAASTIKVPVMVEAFARVAEGGARWDETLALTASAKVEGAGLLTELAPGLSLTLRDAVHLMIVISDNTVTNLVIDRLGADAVNARMDALGLPQTRLLRKVGGGGASRAGQDPANQPFGLGVSTPREMVYTERGRSVMALTVDDLPEADWTVENPGLLLLSRLSLVLIDGLGRPSR